MMQNYKLTIQYDGTAGRLIFKESGVLEFMGLPKDVKLDITCLKKAFLTTIPVMTGYIVLGIGFGMLLQTRGYGVLWAFAMSFLIYAGSMQYVAVDLLTGGVSFLTVALTTLAVNARHLFYGISMVDKYKKESKQGFFRKYFLFWTLTDETYSLVCSDEPKQSGNPSSYYLYVSVFDYFYWVFGSVLGALLGEVIPFSTEGIDFSLTALFLTVFVEQWLTSKNHLAAIVGIVSSVLCLLLFGSGKFLIPAMVLIALLLILLRKKEGITNE